MDDAAPIPVNDFGYIAPTTICADGNMVNGYTKQVRYAKPIMERKIQIEYLPENDNKRVPIQRA